MLLLIFLISPDRIVESGSHSIYIFTPSGIVTIAHLWHLYSEEDQLDIARELVGLYHMQMFQLLMDILDKMIEKDREKEEWFK